MALDKVIDSAQLDADLTAVADAIRAKGGTAESMEFPDGFVTAVEGIQAGGDDSFLFSIVERTITELDTDKFTFIGYGAFFHSSLTKVRLPKATRIGYQGFYQSASIKTIELPEVTRIDGDAFRDCGSVESIYVPKVEVVANGVFQNTKITSIDFPALKGFGGGQALAGCKSLKTVILRSATLCTLTSYNVFWSTYFAEGYPGGVLLVPSALVESYKTATNWSVVYGYGHNRFLPLEDYTVDGTITGEIDWDKVNALFEEATE